MDSSLMVATSVAGFPKNMVDIIQAVKGCSSAFVRLWKQKETFPKISASLREPPYHVARTI
jgi:hypothetical protein